jgi:uncharacterized protein YbbC (DUF1343 family)
MVWAIALLTARCLTGAEVMNQTRFAEFEGQRVGLVTNHTAMIGNTHLVDALHANPKIKLQILFGPEHGLRGLADAGAKVSDSVDPSTGVPIVSLYGKIRRPSTDHLKNVDVLVYDIQDIGSRFYTYISTMGECMQSAAQAGIPFTILDRPNPLGGAKIEGYVLQPEHSSFVGAYPIPIRYGLTAGELAQMIKGEKFLPGLEKLDLRIIKVQNWTRDQLHPETGLPWIKPSPNIPDFETALVYAGTCLFESVHASEGRGTPAPFLTIGAPYLNAESLIQTLKDLPGAKFSATKFTPKTTPGMAANPRFKNEGLNGIKISLTDPKTFDPVATSIHLIHGFYTQAKGINRIRFFNANWITKLAGTKRLQQDLTIGKTPDEIIASWRDDLTEFAKRRKPYLLYP